MTKETLSQTEQDYFNRLAIILRHLRIHSELTQCDLAQKVGHCKSAIARLEQTSPPNPPKHILTLHREIGRLPGGDKINKQYLEGIERLIPAHYHRDTGSLTAIQKPRYKPCKKDNCGDC